MSEDKMKEKIITLYFIEESLLISVLRDVVTFSFLGLLVYVSLESTWWTFFSGCMAIAYIAGLAVKQSPTAKKFKSFEDMKQWVNEQ
jgi:hypothetical protein